MDGALTVLIDERALVARATVEPAAFAAIYDHYFPRIYAYVRYRTPDRATADDLTATIFTRALERLAAYDGAQGPFAPWLFTIARNAVSDYLRAGRRRRWLPLDRLRDQAGDDPPPDEVALTRERRDALLAAVGALSARERDLIGLKFGAGLTNRRIAALTGLSESNVGVILYRAVRRLRAALDAEEPSHA